MELSTSIYMHNCKEDDIVVKLNHSESRWLSISSTNVDVSLNLFFSSQEDQEGVLGKLYTELDILQPKF